jgi:hypothetical protein
VARFFFHLRDGIDVLLDPDGREFADASKIPAAALAEARSIVSHDALEGRILLDQHIDVADASGAIVHSVAFHDAVEVIWVDPHRQ